MNKFPILASVERPDQLTELDLPQLESLAEELRAYIIETVQRTGGHLAPSLGVVELTLALLRVFPSLDDRIIWDVGHQAYAHKLLTGRKKDFPTLRQLGGLSGFPRRVESAYDAFDTGHSSTSISAALGMTIAKRLQNKPGRVVAVIGDGSLTAGLAFEGLNHAGDLDEDLIVVLNDNGMSIAANVGAVSRLMSRAFSGRIYQTLRRAIERALKNLPGPGREILGPARRLEESIMAFFTPGILFEAFQFNYIGPVEGHRLDRLIEVFENVKDLSGPVLVHVLTQKGKGYAPAEQEPSLFHGINAAEPDVLTSPPRPDSLSLPQAPTYTEVFGQTLLELAEQDSRIIAITAAMPDGTGLIPFAQKYPERFLDVGIAEQHAVTMSAGLALQDMKPVVAIYSTFMQRAVDQVIHDVCLTNLPVVFALDRAGIVGRDGATHQGVFDLSLLRSVPNLSIMSPKDENELRHMLFSALQHEGPVVLRYSRDQGTGQPFDPALQSLPWGQGQLLRQGADITFIGLGIGVQVAQTAAHILSLEGIQAAVINARFVKPLDKNLILKHARQSNRVITVEENMQAGGFGSAVLEFLNQAGYKGALHIIALEDRFVEHGSQAELRSRYHVDHIAVLEAARSLIAST